MNTTATRMMLALSCGLLWAGPAMSANEMRFSDLEARIAAVEQKTSAIPGLKSAAFLSDGDPIDAVAPNDADRTHADEELSSPSIFSGTSSTAEVVAVAARVAAAAAPVSAAACACGSCVRSANAASAEWTAAATEQWAATTRKSTCMFLRTHMMEDVVGKLSEKYEFTPRFILGYETAERRGCPACATSPMAAPPTVLSARRRHSASSSTCSTSKRPASSSRAATNWSSPAVSASPASRRGLGRRSGRARRARHHCGGRFPHACSVAIAVSNGRPSCGARWSVLGGDWEGSDDGFVEPLRDDNVVVQELYGGVEYSCHYCNYVLWARLVFEMQNWHSDVMSQSAGVDSIGFVGPGHPLRRWPSRPSLTTTKS